MWEEGDVPVVEHAKHFPRCPFICNLPVGNVPIEEDTFQNTWEPPEEEKFLCMNEEKKTDETLEEEVERLREERLCKICVEKQVSVVFLSCGHAVSCRSCALRITKCAICRKRISSVVPIYMC